MLKQLGRCIYRMKKESVAVLAMIFSGSCAVIYRHINSSKHSKDDNDFPSYIYLPFENAGHTEQVFPFKILQLAKSKNKKDRHSAIRALAVIPELHESQYQMLAQASDLRTTVGLARIFDVALQFFLSPPFPQLSTELFESEFQALFQDLSSDNSSQCAQYLTQHANKRLQFQSLETDQSLHDTIGEMNYSLYFRKKDLLLSLDSVKLCLEALLAHSIIPSHRYIMANNGLLKLLHYLRIHYESDHVKSLIGQIISNLALEENLHAELFATGWIGILACWIKSSNIQISLPAVKALANMDRDYDSVQFEDGVYLLYPQYREQDKKINADIIFIHGIMGGAFRTWRQHDSMNPDTGKKEALHIQDVTALESADKSCKYSFCWPKDWLAKDFPLTRLIAVDYTSHFSEWKSKYPVNKESRYLKTRAKDTLQKLIASGIGERPIVWVSHSMGGLIVKQILVDASTSQDKRENSVVQNTAGVIFYSVPHLGTPVANLKPGVVMLLQPSIEARLLKQGSPELLRLHDEFTHIVLKQDIRSLSFGETLKSKIGFNWNSVLVPKESAGPGFGDFIELPIDHLNTCKPVTPDSPNYQLLKVFLQKIFAEDQRISKQHLFGYIPEACIVWSMIH